MKRQPLDMYDEMPRDMKNYLRHNGWHFNKYACEFAVGLMEKVNPNTKQKEPIVPYTKEQVDEMLKKYNVKVENNVGHDYVFVANMGKADYLKSSIPDEQHLAMYVKDVIDDPDAADGTTFRRWYATMVGNGVLIDWAEIM